MQDQQEYLAKQYRTDSNLSARIRLHQRFSVNPHGWHRWIFDQFSLPPKCSILELGCGSGDLWFENRDRIPEGWEMILTDFSAGMLQRAQSRLIGVYPFQYELLDAGSIPYRFKSRSFDAVIANHMLYHLTDRKGPFSEIGRILKPGGLLYATTIGKKHLHELSELLIRFDPELRSWGSVANTFTLENGREQLSEWFSEVERRRYPDGLKVTEDTPLVEYVLSGWVETRMPKEKVKEFTGYVEQALENAGGEIYITKDSGIFVAAQAQE